MKKIIAIDGPAGAGKSTIAKILAEKLQYIYIDTGAMYRVVTCLALEQGIDLSDEDALAGLAEKHKIYFEKKEDGYHTYCDDRDLSQVIRSTAVSEHVSQVAQQKALRLVLVNQQRRLALHDDVVLDGRDIGTYVFPEADCKIFLTASIDERAQRRYQEVKVKDPQVDFEALKLSIARRDENDYNRDFAPLKQAEDARVVDTTGLEIGAVVDIIMNHCYVV